MKVTVPSPTVAVDGLFAVTLAESVTAGPPNVPLAFETVVVVFALVTVWDTAALVLPLKPLPLFPHPLPVSVYTAVTLECVPVVSVDTVTLAAPLAT